jgi:hypothetical protein
VPERSRAGRAIVRNTPEGKALATNKLMSAAMASVARLSERLSRLERKTA